MGVSEKRSLRALEYRLQMKRLVEVFCATQRHQKTKNKKNETQTKVRMALPWEGIQGGNPGIKRKERFFF